MPGLVQRRYTIPITCCLDGRAHDVADENFAVGRSTGKYLAECGYRVLAAAMAAPIGRPCPECAAVAAVARQTACPARRARHRRPGWWWRMLHPSRGGGTELAAP